MKKMGIWVFGLLMIILIAKQFFSSKKEGTIVEDNIYPLDLSGEVDVILNNRGFKVKLKNESKFFNLSGACNDTTCLAQNINWGDSIFKKPNSNLVILKSKINGKVSTWTLPINP